MKLPLICMECAQLGYDEAMSNMFITELRDDSLYDLICANGHKSTIALQEQKFELLFDIGAHAIRDGYYREAVSSFTSSLERFYEFFIKASLFEESVDETVVNAAWKTVSNQSERQLGAFIFLYTKAFNKPPILLKDADVQFRNAVIHKGKIPSKDEALTYGQMILDIMRLMIVELQEKFPTGIKKVMGQHTTKWPSPLEKNMSYMTTPTIVGLTRADKDYQSRTLERAIGELKIWK